MLKHLKEAEELKKILETGIPLAKSEFTELSDYYNALCKNHDIYKPPKVIVIPDLPMSYAHTRDNSIILGKSHLVLLNNEHKAILGHELGHIIRGDVGASERSIEFKTDQLASAIMNNKNPLINIVKRSKQYFDNQVKTLKDDGSTYAKKLSESRQYAHTKSYGTHTERIANIEGADLSVEVEKLEKLLKQRRNNPPRHI